MEKWNACCEKGEDDYLYPMPPEWLHAVKEPPFYGCRIGGNLYGTKAGLLINEDMQVMGTDGRPIEACTPGGTPPEGLAARTATWATLSWVRSWATSDWRFAADTCAAPLRWSTR